MNKYLKLLAIPLALTVTEGCASFHNAIRNVRHSIERATKRSPEKKADAVGFACRENVSKSIRAASQEVIEQLDEKRIWHYEIITTPEEPKEEIWPNIGNEKSYTSVCAIAQGYAKPKPVKKEEKPDEDKLADANQ